MENYELFLIKQLALSWNNLNTDHIEQYLSENVIYESQYVFSSLVNKTEVLDYLRGKFSTIKRNMKAKQIKVEARIGYLPSMNKRLCIVLSQILGSEKNQVSVLIETKDNLISRIDVCFIPDPKEVILINEK